MKRCMTYLIAGALLPIAGLSLCGCAGTRIKQLSGPDFIKRAGQTEQINSFSWTRYVGSTGERAYLEYGHPALLGAGAQVSVYWTPLSELPSNVVAQIKAGARPWTNWTDRTVPPPNAPIACPAPVKAGP